MNPSQADPKIHHWEQRFATDEYVFGTEPNAFLLSQQHRLKPGQSVLAVADGEGRNGVWLARHGLLVTAVEASANALTKARRLAEKHGVSIQLEQANLLAWQWPVASYDVVVAIFIQFLAPGERERVFEAMKHALKPGGLLILQGYTPRQLEFRTGGPSEVEQLYTSRMVQSLLSGMQILQLHEHDDVLAEGFGHSGMSAVIDVVARLPA